MTRILSILAATNFSLEARHAAERVAMLAKTTAIQRGTLLHVLEKPQTNLWKQSIGVSGKDGQDIIDDVSHSLARLAEDIRKHTAFTLEPQVRVGNPADVIVQVAENFDLLVIGAGIQQSARGLTIGPTSRRLLKKSRPPLLLVKCKPDMTYKRVLVAVDFSEKSREALSLCGLIAPEALIYTVHIFETVFERKMLSAGLREETLRKYRIRTHLEAEAQMTRFMESAGLDTRRHIHFIESGHAAKKLLEITNKWGHDLIIVGRHGKSRIEQLLFGSVTKHLIARSQCDVLVME